MRRNIAVLQSRDRIVAKVRLLIPTLLPRLRELFDTGDAMDVAVFTSFSS